MFTDFAHHYRLATGYPLDPLVAKVLAEAPPEVLAALPGVRALVEAAERRERDAVVAHLRRARVRLVKEARAEQGSASEMMYASALNVAELAVEIERAAHREPGEAEHG